jgi:4-hydroxy-tetrahydrodipicolinate synthase
MSVGGKGVVSVLANIAPKDVHDMTRSFLNGDVKNAAGLQLKYLELVEELFRESSPAPVKAALNMMGFKAGPARLPLVPLLPKNAELLKNAMEKAGLL